MSTASMPERKPLATPSRRRLRPMDLLERYGLLLLLGAVIALFAIWVPGTFATWDNIRNVAANQAVVAVIALALVIPLVAHEFDLSVGAVAGLCSFVLVGVITDLGLPLGVAAVVTVLVGAAIGLLNGVIVTSLGVNSIITTLGVGTVVTGLVNWRSNGESISVGIPPALTDLGSGSLLGIPGPVIALAVIAGAVYYVLQHTPFGRALAAVGANRDAAQLVGVRVRRTTVLAFTAAGGLAGLAGVLLVARATAANPQAGPNYLIPALAAAFLGATAVRPGTFNVGGTLIAVFFFAVSVSGLALAGVPFYVESIFTGAILVLGVAFSALVARRHRSGAGS